MSNYLILLPIIFPILSGALLSFFKCKENKNAYRYIEVMVLLNSCFTFFVLFNRPSSPVVLYQLTNNISMSFYIDRMSMVFASIVALLWPLATMYAFEYMEKDNRKKSFFLFYTMTFGITLGIAFSANLETMYLFYELLTLVTLPLVMHEMNWKSILASRTYMVYSLAGASFAFISLMFIINYGDTTSFVWGGVLGSLPVDKELLMQVWYLFAFFGFGVKAAIFPFHKWLPRASVAPTPVTALLHAVAVVKAGAFAIGRLTYYSYGTDILKGTWVQYVAMSAALITIIFGSCMAFKEQHIKRRLAYSTVSNLSYIIFGFTLMSDLGLIAGLSHMISHAFGKIILFMCVGAIMTKAKKKYVFELDGIGLKAMPFTMACFAIASLSVICIPPFPGFISKWNLIKASVLEGGFAYAGVAVLLISGLLTAMYLLSIVFRAFFVDKETYDENVFKGAHDPGWKMKLSMSILVIAIFAMSFVGRPIISFLSGIGSGL